MSELRWSECDELVHKDPIAALLCRTGKLNDHAHETDVRLTKIEHHVNWFGVITTGLGLLSTGLGIFKTLHG